jgi:diguanylate cyclase (GGDEF)-like protein
MRGSGGFNSLVRLMSHSWRMGSRFIQYAVAAMVGLLLSLMLASGALGREAIAEYPSSCRAYGDGSESLGTLARSVRRWQCGGGPYSLHAERVYLKFDLAREGPLPRYLITRRAALRAIHYIALDDDGRGREVRVMPERWQNSRADGMFRVPLTQIDVRTQQVIIAFDGVSHDMTLESTRLVPFDPADGADQTRKLLILAALCGILATPLIFNVAFYRVLREPFVLWHSSLVITLLATVLVSSGLLASLIDVPVMTLSAMATMVFGLSVASGSMFTYSFVEQGRMHPMLRRALLWSALAAVALSAFHAAFPFVARPVQSPIYTAAFLPILLIFLLALVDALRRGSRAAKFQAVGWSPMVIVGLIRLVTGLVPSLSNHDALLLFYVACVLEVLSTAMGVADRFMSLKDQRDRARTEAEVLERLAERDPLTGLFNRRAMEGRFDEMVADGFTSMAVLDLDYFKTINDLYGHGVGDAVLKAAADALQPNQDVQAYRIGGEEFLLLLRGEDAIEQAERRRREISAVVGRAKLSMAQRVTASMGMIHMTAGPSGRVDFTEAFERADKLLYEAKITGRDRAMTDAATMAVKPQPELEVRSQAGCEVAA